MSHYCICCAPLSRHGGCQGLRVICKCRAETAEERWVSNSQVPLLPCWHAPCGCTHKAYFSFCVSFLLCSASFLTNLRTSCRFDLGDRHTTVISRVPFSHKAVGQRVLAGDTFTLTSMPLIFLACLLMSSATRLLVPALLLMYHSVGSMQKRGGVSGRCKKR